MNLRASGGWCAPAGRRHPARRDPSPAEFQWRINHMAGLPPPTPPEASRAAEPAPAARSAPLWRTTVEQALAAERERTLRRIGAAFGTPEPNGRLRASISVVTDPGELRRRIAAANPYVTVHPGGRRRRPGA